MLYNRPLMLHFVGMFLLFDLPLGSCMSFNLSVNYYLSVLYIPLLHITTALPSACQRILTRRYIPPCFGGLHVSLYPLYTHTCR